MTLFRMRPNSIASRPQAMRKLLFGSVFAWATLVGSAAHATSYNILTADMTVAWDGQCSFREAILASNSLAINHECPAGTGVDDIYLANGTYTAPVEMEIHRNVTISGVGAPLIAANVSSVVNAALFTVYGTLTIDNVTLRNDSTAANTYMAGIAVMGGGRLISNDRLRVTGFTWTGIYANAPVSLTGARIDHNTNHYPDSNWNNGGGIWIRGDENGRGSIELLNSTISDNTADGKGGGLYFGANNGSHLSYSTFANNKAAQGGGIYLGTVALGYFEGYHLSVGNNTATISGGGIEEHHGGSGLSIDGSVISNNTAPSGANFLRTLASGGTSTDTVWGSGVTQASLGCTTAGWTCTHDLFNTDAKFGVLATMGGIYYDMPVLPLLKGSPAIDFGAVKGALSTDQRGLAPNVDGDNNGTAKIDAGAMEKNLIWESEDTLQWTNSSGDLVNIDVAAGYSKGLGRLLSANATNDYVKYVIPIPEAGTYDITIKIKTAPNGGQFRLGTANSVSGGVTEIATDIEGYSGATAFPAAVSLGSVTFASAQKCYVRLRVVGKNGSSTGRFIATDYIKFTKTN